MGSDERSGRAQQHIHNRGTYSANGAAGTAVITATSVSDTAKTATLTITVAVAPAITTTTLPAGVEGTAYSQAIAKTAARVHSRSQ